jgi:hypothetical protein
MEEIPYVKVRHAGLLEVIPQPPGDDIHRDVVGDNPTRAGHCWLGKKKIGRKKRGEESVF